MPAVKECITIHIGQAGCQIGQSLWELFCIEHGIQPDGNNPSDTTHGDATDTYNTFFSETASGKHVPRSVFIDTDPSSKEDILSGKYGKLFHPDSLIGYKQDCKNNFFEGRTRATAFRAKEDTMDRIRMAVDLCQNLQGFFVFHSVGGGTGSGIGTEILNALHDQFDKKVIFQPLVYPSSEFSSSIVEPYNCILATHYTRDSVDLSLMIDNQAAYAMCSNNLKKKNPTFDDLNKLIAQMISTCTTSLRYESMLNASLQEITTNMVPTREYRYATLALSPLRAAGQGQHENFSTAEIIQDLFAERNQLCNVKNLQLNRYLAATVLLRGLDENPAEEAADDAASQASGQTGKAKQKAPIQVTHAQNALASLMNPAGSYRQPLRFLPWLEKGGFKVGVVGEPPKVPEGFMSKTERQGVLLGNTTAVRQIFVRQYTKFLKLFYHKAYVWQFIDANGEPDMFYEAREGVRELIDAYEKLLDQCVVMENSRGGSMELKGRTPAGAPPGP
eukprot:gnl/TRDRNA2_/TRDRNA2_153703_c0_seq1.p1 gnl/TRDRNA2_/TRDRNA2_153703_c0~~gnl/TRDRNA2_/TRDRNA2_153703_c0_seq1.p1  ORF type:complete len:503 (-),score=104.54 gnl/TRDRNA2_/TRDRNA2_153703_c0_seq1:50-1558(-)